MVLTLSCILLEDHMIQSEQNSGDGRCDILILPKKEKEWGAVLAIKAWKSKISKDRLDSLSQEALNQMEEKNYISTLKERKVSKIYTYGIAFAGKKVSVYGGERRD